jgi:multidrug efflux pump subunit AcrA (membrane-fusion protein)
VRTRSKLSRLPLPRRLLEWGLAILAVALVAIAITSLGSGSSSSSAATRRTTMVGKGVVQSTVSGNGTLEPAQKVELSFGASGEVTAIDVKSGEKVTKGQVLASVDSSSARASLASAEAQLIESEEAAESAKEAEEAEEENEETAYEGGATMELVGLMSKEGTASTTREEEATASAGETEAEPPAAEEKAAKEEPAKTSTKTEKATKEETTKTSTEAEQPVKEEEATPTESTSAATTPSASTAGGATVSLPTAEANLREAELSVKSARQEVRETTLRAPISGTIAQVSGSVGETVSGGSSSGGGISEASSLGATGGESTGSESSGSAFMVIAQLHRLKMEVDFSESDIGKVRKGQIATVSIDSMEGTELSGRVTELSVLPGEGSTSVVEYPATILVSQSAKGVRAGMSASAEVVVEQVKDALTVSSEAISAVGGKTVTVEEDGKEVTKSVTTGLEGDETTQVISGLKAGQTLILPEAAVATGGLGEAGATEFGGLPSGFPSGGGGFTPPSGGGFPGAP